MKKLFFLLLIIIPLLATAQKSDDDLLVLTSLDSIKCTMRSVTADGIAFTIRGIENTLPKSSVYMVKVATEAEPRYYNTSFDMALAMQLKQIMPKVNLHQQLVNPYHQKAGSKLVTGGSLLMAGVLLPALGFILISETEYPEIGYVAMGAGGVSFIVGTSFIIDSGRLFQRRRK